MRITLFAHSFPPVIGGAQTWQYFLAKYLCELGHQVQVVTGDLPEGYLDQDFSSEKFEVVRIAGFREASKLRVGIDKVIADSFYAISAFKPDVVHSHGYVPGLIISFIKNALKAKHVFSYHATPIPEDGKLAGIFSNYELEKSFTQYILTKSDYDHFIANSDYYFNSSTSRGVPKSKASRIYYGIDLGTFNSGNQSLKTDWGFNSKDYVILCPIRLIERKGIYDILKAMSLLKHKEAKLFIPTSRLYTPPHLEEDVINTVDNLNLKDRVKIVFDEVSVFDMPKAYKMADLTVLPSHVEGLGIVLLESLASKTPIVATNAPGIDEIIRDNDTGVTVPVKSPQVLAQKIDWAIDNPDSMKKFTEQGFNFVTQNFDIKNQVKKVEEIYQDVLSQ